MKKALVTGASSGIGRAFAMRLSAMGNAVTLVARHTDALEATLSELPKVAAAPHKILSADLATAEGRAAVMREITETKYDLLINNAGVGAGVGFAEIPLEEIEAMIELNCISLTSLSHSYLQNAVAGDALINVGSIVSFFPYPAFAAYSATKAFVLSLSESLWALYRSKGVHVMTVCPGPTDTNFFKAAGETEDTGAMQSPESVVDEAFRALAKKKIFVVTGSKNKFFAFCAKYSPVRITLWFADRW